MIIKKLQKYLLHIFISLLLLVTSVQFSFGVQRKEEFGDIVHFVQARHEFNKDNDKIKFDSRKLAIRDFYNIGKYDQEVLEVCKQAENYFNKIDVTDKSVIFFDVDDTAVRNTCWEIDLLEINNPLTKVNLPVLGLYKFLIAKGFKIIFITGRDATRYEETKNELEQSGYLGFHDLILMPIDFFKNAPDKLGNWKYTVRLELSKYYEIIGSIGDRDLDFAEGHTGYIAKLPNYLY